MIFKVLSVAKNCLRPESAPLKLRHIEVIHKKLFSVFLKCTIVSDIYELVQCYFAGQLSEYLPSTLNWLRTTLGIIWLTLGRIGWVKLVKMGYKENWE